MSKKLSRRKFIARGALGTFGIAALGTFVFRNPIRRKIIGMAETAVLPYAGAGTEPNLWFEITKNNTVIFHSPKVEMGQGVFTGLTQIALEELDVSLEQFAIIGASTHSGVVDASATGGSTSISSLWQPLRELAATFREMLKNEAAKKLGVEAATLTTKNGIISGGGKSITYAEAAKGVTKWKIPKTPELRPVKNMQFVGKPIPRTDLDAKIFGKPIFGLDAALPGMLYAAVKRPEIVDADFAGIDTSEAEKMPGVVKIVKRDDWVGVIAETQAQAIAAEQKIKVDYGNVKRWTQAEIDDMIQVGKGDSFYLQKKGSELDSEDKDVVSMAFSSPTAAHAQIELNGAVAEYKDGEVTVILSTQSTALTRKGIAQELGIDEEKITIIPTFLGGGFGRRSFTPHAVRAVEMAKEVGKPVKYVFSRQEEFQHDHFRPPTRHLLKGKLDKQGKLENLEHHYASSDVVIHSNLLPGFANAIIGTDFGAMRGGNSMYQKIPNLRVKQWHTSLPYPTGIWRSLGLLANTFAIESFLDEMAAKAGKHPADFRLAMLDNDKVGQRIAGVIKKVVEISGYYDQPKDGRAMGLAASLDALSPCAQVVELSVENNEIKIHKVFCAFDCGLAVNPDQVKAQCEGAINMGISAAMHEQITLEDGAVSQTIFGPYAMALMKHSPREIVVELVQGDDIPLPVGEPPLGPIGAAIGNAVKRLTGQRLTAIPIKLG